MTAGVMDGGRGRSRLALPLLLVMAVCGAHGAYGRTTGCVRAVCRAQRARAAPVELKYRGFWEKASSVDEQAANEGEEGAAAAAVAVVDAGVAAAADAVAAAGVAAGGGTLGEAVRADFDLLSQSVYENKPLVYLDSAATSQVCC